MSFTALPWIQRSVQKAVVCPLPITVNVEASKKADTSLVTAMGSCAQALVSSVFWSQSHRACRAMERQPKLSVALGDKNDYVINKTDPRFKAKQG